MPAEATPKRAPQAAFPSPNEIVRLVVAASLEDTAKPFYYPRRPSLVRLWRLLKISPKQRMITERGEQTGEDVLSTCWDCSADIVRTERILPGQDPEAIVRVCVLDGNPCRFLIMHRAKSGWTLVDFADSLFNKYTFPEAHVVAANDHRFLVVKDMSTGGTGVGFDGDSWYELRKAKLHWLLSVPAKGHDVNADPARIFSTRFTRYRQTGERESLEFVFVVDFQTRAEQFLWRNEWKVSYSRGPNQQAFRFDPQLSDLPEETLNKVFSYDTLTHEELIGLSFDTLWGIAQSPSDWRKPWLKELVSKSKITPEVKKLREALEGEAKKRPD